MKNLNQKKNPTQKKINKKLKFNNSNISKDISLESIENINDFVLDNIINIKNIGDSIEINEEIINNDNLNINKEISGKELKNYIDEFNNYEDEYPELTREEIKNSQNVNPKAIKVKNEKDLNLSLEDALEELDKNNSKNHFNKISYNFENKKLENNINNKDINIILKGDSIKYEKRIFRLDKNATKYIGKETRKFIIVIIIIKI